MTYSTICYDDDSVQHFRDERAARTAFVALRDAGRPVSLVRNYGHIDERTLEHYEDQ